MAMKSEDESGPGLPKAVIAAIVIVVVVVTVIVVLSKKESFSPVGPSMVAPAFTLPNLAGGESALSDYKGKVVFLNFWATWCKPCEEEMPSMQLLYEELGGSSFEIVAVSIDSEKVDVVEKFVKEYGITFTVLHDRKGRIKELYMTTGVPESFILDQNGVVAEKVWGPRDWSTDISTKTIRDLIKNGPGTAESYKGKKGPH